MLVFNGFFRPSLSYFSRSHDHVMHWSLKLPVRLNLTRKFGSPVERLGYKATKQVFLDDFKVDVTEYEHINSKANVVHFHTNDRENVFSVCYRTPARDDTGIAHIMEHSVLCGSKNYPSKEPFVDMMKGSLYTFLNAMTFPDRTCYPVASMSDKEFLNLTRVYLDAVFYPKAVENSKILQQEGWHYTINSEGKLRHSGVVYNEMKGVYSNPLAIMYRKRMKAMFPATNYRYDSGGDPENIPSLTLNMFRDFFNTHYSIENATFYFYGRAPIERNLELLNEYLNSSTKKEEGVFRTKGGLLSTKVQLQPHITSPISIVEKYEGTDDIFSLSWMLHGVGNSYEAAFKHSLPESVSLTSPVENLLFSILNQLLLGPAGMLRKRLIASNLGMDVLDEGFSTELSHPSFGVGMRGISNPENVIKIETLILDTLNEVLKVGFTDKEIKAAINTIEFNVREFRSDGYPRGLALMMAHADRNVFDKDGYEDLQFSQNFKEIRKLIDTHPAVLTSLIDHYLLKNTHRVSFHLKAVEGYQDKEFEKYETEMGQKLDALSKDEKTNIIENEEELKKFQTRVDSQEIKDKIPKLLYSDIDRNSEVLDYRVDQINQNTQYIYHTQDSNGISYLNLTYALTNLSLTELSYLSLLFAMLTRSGAAELSADDLTTEIREKTGGISISAMFTDFYSPFQSNEDTGRGHMIINGASLDSNLSELNDLIQKILHSPHLHNREKAIEILKERVAMKEQSLLTNGHVYAKLKMAESQNSKSYAQELYSGVHSYYTTKILLTQAETSYGTIEDKLTQVLKKILVGERIVQLSSMDENPVIKSNLTLDKNFSNNNFSIDAREFLPEQTWVREFQDLPKKIINPYRAFIIPSQINYVGLMGKFPEAKKPLVLYETSSNFVGTGPVWNTIRVQNGAYGARFRLDNNHYNLVSYRDPHIDKTIDAYRDIVSNLPDTIRENLNEEFLLQNIISTMRLHDAPLLPRQKALAILSRHLRGVSHQDVQLERTTALELREEDIVDFGEKLASGMKQDQGKVVVFGSKEAISKSKNDFYIEDVMGAEKKMF